MNARRISESLQIKTSPIKNEEFQFKHLPWQTKKEQNQTQQNRRNKIWNGKKSAHISDSNSSVSTRGLFSGGFEHPSRRRLFETLRKGEQPLQDAPIHQEKNSKEPLVI